MDLSHIDPDLIIGPSCIPLPEFLQNSPIAVIPLVNRNEWHNIQASKIRVIDSHLNRNLISGFDNNVSDEIVNEVQRNFSYGEDLAVMILCRNRLSGLIAISGIARKNSFSSSPEIIQLAVTTLLKTRVLGEIDEKELIHAIKTGHWFTAGEERCISDPLKFIPVRGLSKPKL
jgi:hypothetical protein